MKDVTKKKLSDALKGNKNALGKPKPDGFGEMLSEKLTGQTRTPEQRKRISDAKMGHDVSPETKAKISKANKGKKRTPEQRARMAAAQRARYEKD